MRIRKLVALAVVVMLARASSGEAIPERAEDVCPILIGEKIPPATLLDEAGKPYDLAASIARKPTILIFYRGGWCPYCNMHLAQLQKAEQALVDLGYQILAVSPDRPEKLAAPKDKNGLHYVLLSDSAMVAAKALGLAFRVDDAIVTKYRGYGIDLEADSGKKHHLLPVPAAFVLGRDGTVKFSYVNPDYKTRISGALLIAAAKAAIE
ncbi:MAG: AhpC/TSA family protein [Acidobacteria bacterium]|nr:AhpC/TSA family protein [Acidobacteriota bacterium]